MDDYDIWDDLGPTDDMWYAHLVAVRGDNAIYKILGLPEVDSGNITIIPGAAPPHFSSILPSGREVAQLDNALVGIDWIRANLPAVWAKMFLTRLRGGV